MATIIIRIQHIYGYTLFKNKNLFFVALKKIVINKTILIFEHNLMVQTYLHKKNQKNIIFQQLYISDIGIKHL